MNVTRGLVNAFRKADGLLSRPFRVLPSSQQYWEKRYARGRNSGTGSRGDEATFKSHVVNRLLVEHDIDSAVEFGCGDGYQLGLIAYPEYRGFDVSPSAVKRCREQYRGDSSKSFRVLSDYNAEKADLSLSLDVIYHLVEDHVFDQHMRLLFGSSRNLVAIYSTNYTLPADQQPHHIRHRRFTDWIAQHEPDWKLIERTEDSHDAVVSDGPVNDATVAFHIFAR